MLSMDRTWEYEAAKRNKTKEYSVCVFGGVHMLPNEAYSSSVHSTTLLTWEKEKKYQRKKIYIWIVSWVLSPSTICFVLKSSVSKWDEMVNESHIWKFASIVPILKSSWPPKSPSLYCHILLLSSVCYLLKLMNNQITQNPTSTHTT